MKRRVIVAALLAVLLLLPGKVRADGLNVVGHYANADGTFLDIATFSEKGETVGILGIAHKVSITFSNNEWPSFVAIWRKAQATRSDSFQFVGTFKETGTTYNSLLTAAAGPGVQLTINDQPGTYVFVLSPNDYARFDGDVAKVASILGSNPGSK
jgi:hypothetical protein